MILISELVQLQQNCGNMTDSLKSLMREYRTEKKQLETLSRKVDSLQQQIAAIKSQASSITNDIQDKKVLIDFCIETGISPVEAKLSYSLDEMRHKIQHLYFSNYIDYNTQGVPGATGAIGSITISNSSGYYYTGPPNGIGLSSGSVSIANTGNIHVGGAIASSTNKKALLP